MKKIVMIFKMGLFIIGVSLITGCATAKKNKLIIDKEGTDWKKLKLEGTVKAIREVSTVQYPEEEAKVRTSEYGFNRYGKQLFSDTDEYSHQSTYNSEGQILEMKQYFQDRLEKKIVHSYSSEGDKIAKSTYMSPTFETMEEWEAHQAKKSTLPHEGLYLQNKLEIHEDGHQTITVYKQTNEVDHIQKEIYEHSKLVEVDVKYPSSDAFGYKKTWKYDDHGNLLKFKKYVSPEERLEHLWEYEYDEKNRIIKETHLRYMPQSSTTFKKGHLKDYSKGYYLDEDLSYISTFEYDANGSLISKIGKKYNGELVRKITYELTYDSNQNLIQENVHDSKGSSAKNYIEYDKNGNEIFYRSVDTKGNLISKVIRKFDSVSNMTERVVYESDGSISLDESYVYDSKGNVKEHTVKKPLEETIEIKAYDYDDSGNWVKLEQKFLSSKTDEVLQHVINERKIIYYE
ncbi:RHS repeat domain-containing protein [Leeuwenhoekiella marinoflava]|nr:hypothetical protein [Leeuwenhoekiella marinoflava]